MPEQIENRMVVDSEWDEIEYGVPRRRTLNRKRRSYDEAEMEDFNDIISKCILKKSRANNNRIFEKK